MKQQANKTCKHEDTIFGICLDCKCDTGALEIFKSKREAQLNKFSGINEIIKASQ